MHTAICSFASHAQAEHAAERLVQSGFDRRDVHLQRGPVDAGGAPNDAWDALEREVAVDRSRLVAFGDFFMRLFSHADHSGHRDTYSRAVSGGATVVVVDAPDEMQARRAQALMQELSATEPNVIHRPSDPPVRDLVGEPLPKE